MKYLKAIVVLLLVLAAGICIGVVGTRYVIKRDIRRLVLQPELVRLRLERELTREVDLNPNQQAQLDAILVKFQQDIANARKDRTIRVRPLFVEANRRIHEILTPDQQEKYERYIAENGFFSFGGAQIQSQGQNLPRLQKLKKLREIQLRNQTPAQPASPAQPTSPPPVPASEPTPAGPSSE